MIEINDLTFYYSDYTKPALLDINLRIEPGEFILVAGSSGSGKSSLCRCLNGLIPHFYGGRMRGEVNVCGKNVVETPTKVMAEYVGLVFQDPENQLLMSEVEREIAFGLENLCYPVDMINKRVEEALDSVGIAGIRHRHPNELSGGEKQKVAIASNLALHPQVLVLDEPTSELDPKSAEEVINVLERLNDELGLTIVLVEHRLERVVQHVDRIIALGEGRVELDGNPREMLATPKFRSLGVGLPPIISLAHALRDRGFNLSSIPLTVKEGRRMFTDFFKKPKKIRLDDRKAGGEVKVEFRDVSYTYPNGIDALDNISLKIHAGEFIAVMGRNASGKTTLVKHINGLLKPKKGSVLVSGLNTKDVTVAEMADRVGYVFQNPNVHLFADTVEEEIRYVLENLGRQRGEIHSKTEDVLGMFSLGDKGGDYPRSLSGGEKQRVALASVFVSEPDILILDEPTRGMDYASKNYLMNLLDGYRGDGKVVVLVSHDIETVAGHVDRIVLMSEGRIVVDDSKRKVMSKALLFSPQINRMVQGYRGYNVPDNILTVEEAERLIQ